MIEQKICEYFVNSLWQLPLLALAAWLVVRIARPNIVAQHALWLGTLVLGVVMPLRGIDSVESATIAPVANSSQYAPDPLPPVPVSKLDSPLAAPSHQQRLWSMAPLQFHPIHLESRTMAWLIGLYGVSIALGMARLLHGWLAARRLVSNAMEQPLTMLESSLLRACANRIGLPENRIPGLRFLADSTSSPMVVGMRNPVLLLPESLRHRSDAIFDDQALTAVILHELAHIRRRDYLANLLARVLALPIAYHPATQALHARIRQTREMICDASAAQALASRSSYARSLLALAEGLVSPPQPVEAVGLFDHTRNSLEERIMKLTEPKLPLSLALRMTRIAAGVAILVAGSGVAATLHLKATPPVVYAMQTQQSTPAAPMAPSAPIAPMPPVSAVAPSAPVAPHAPEPAPPAPPSPGPAPEVHADLQESPGLTQQERKEIEEQVNVAHDQIRTMTQDLKLNVPITIPPIDLKNFPGPEFDKQMARLKDKLDSSEFRKQMDEMRDKLNSPEFRKQIAEAASKANRDVVNSAEFKKQMEEIHRQVNSPEFRAQIEQSKKLAMEARADAAQHSAEARKQLAEASAAIAEARKQVHDEAVQRQLDEAQRRIDKASKTY